MPSANKNPIYTDSVLVGMAQVTTAQATRDNPGSNIVSIVAAGAQGTRIDLVRVVAIAATTAGMVRLYLNDGSAKRLIHEIAVGAVTPDVPTGVITFEASWALDTSVPLILLSGWSLMATTNNSETFNVFAFGGHY